ncbi:MAG: efflux RND transporter permease subunit [Isosphaeraceae bacterium]|nr:efflux RND transporter permease subunit [Isosphaeraceae bacterium]
MFSRFFIDRPIFAAVLSIVITLAGAVSLSSLPLAMYPAIAPPTVQVDCRYAGASAAVVAETVAAPIEQQVNGVEGMLYMSSQCTNDGSYNLTVTFRQGMDLNVAQVLVQNRVALALPNLPEVIKQAGVTARKRSPDILLSIALNAPGGEYDQLYLSNFASMRLRNELMRIPGVSDVGMLGQQDYSMRIWVDPERLESLGMTAGDVVRAVREQNRAVAAGRIGQPPTEEGQSIQMTIDTKGRLVDPSEFGAIVIRSTHDGRSVRLEDVARVEIGAKSLDVATRLNGVPSISMAIFQLPDSNALETADAIKARIAELSSDFPPGLRYEIRYDTTPFIRESIREVFKTLGESVILVAIVVLLFLQNWRSALIPLVAVPVAIVGTFAVMAGLGFSINNLTLFGLVLSIGIVVDDAIVVVESVEHHLDSGLTPRDATIKAMDEVSGPIIAIGLVLCAVFIPCAFISGIVGQFFRQFALTIAASTLISTFSSLTLSPALAALLLRPRASGASNSRRHEALPAWGTALLFGWVGQSLAGSLATDFLEASESIDAMSIVAGSSVPLAAIASISVGEESVSNIVAAIVGACAGGALGYLAFGLVNRIVGYFFSGFNWIFGKTTSLYVKSVSLCIRGCVLVIVVYVGCLFVTEFDLRTTPKGFIPSQDMGYLMCNIQLPDAASMERTQAVLDDLDRIARATPGVRFTQSMTGQSLLLGAFGSNYGSMFIILEPFEKRVGSHEDRLWRWLDQRRVPDRDDLLMIRYITGGRPPSRNTQSLAELIDGSLGAVLGGPLRRRAPIQSLHGEEIAQRLRSEFAKKIPDAMVTVLGPPPIRGVGRAGGFKLMVEDRGDLGLLRLQQEAEELTRVADSASFDETRNLVTGDIDASGRSSTLVKAFVGLSSVFRANVPQLFADVDRAESLTRLVTLRDLFESLQVYLGSLYINDFNLFGRTWQVIIQAEPRFRNSAEGIRRLTVRNSAGRMVPVGSVATIRERNGPLILTRYNMYPAAPISGSAAPGVSSGEAIAALEDLARRSLSRTMRVEWTELAYLQIQAGDTAMTVFAFAVLMVFLVLAAQYESWSLPLAVILVVPMCLLCAIEGVNAFDEDINIFTQVGFVVLVGLACKNAILIVEFARAQRSKGIDPYNAALDACRLRLRPIVMTSLAFILGVFPLLISRGAGSEMRRTLGVTVFSGMLGVTFFGLLLTPVFFVVIERLAELRVMRSRMARFVGAVLAGALSLGLVPLARTLAARSRTVRMKSESKQEKSEEATTIEAVEDRPSESRFDRASEDAERFGVESASSPSSVVAKHEIS